VSRRVRVSSLPLLSSLILFVLPHLNRVFFPFFFLLSSTFFSTVLLSGIDTLLLVPNREVKWNPPGHVLVYPSFFFFIRGPGRIFSSLLFSPEVYSVVIERCGGSPLLFLHSRWDNFFPSFFPCPSFFFLLAGHGFSHWKKNQSFVRFCSP